METSQTGETWKHVRWKHHKARKIIAKKKIKCLQFVSRKYKAQTINSVLEKFV